MEYYIIKLLIARAKAALSIIENGNEARRVSGVISEFADALQSAMIDVHRRKVDEINMVTLVDHRKN